MLLKALRTAVVKRVSSGIHRQRVLIEKAVSRERNAAQHRIVKSSLCGIGIAAVRLNEPESPAEKCQGNGGTGLVISRIFREIIIKRKGFAAAGGAHTTGDVHTLLGDIFKKGPADFRQFLFLCLQSQICHARIEVECSHAVALCRHLFPYRKVGLHVFLIGEGIGFVAVAGSSGVDKTFRQLEIALLAGVMIQFHKSQLDLFVARRVKGRRVFHPEYPVNEIRIFHGYPEHVVFSCGLLIGDGSLDEVAGTVKLMVGSSGKASLRLHHGKIGIEITIGILGSLHTTHEFVDLCLKLRIPFFFQEIGSSLDPFCHVRLPENMRLIGHAFFPLHFQRFKAPGLLKPVINRIDGHFPAEILLCLPETSGDRAVRKAHRFSTPFFHLVLLSLTLSYLSVRCLR